MIGFRRLFAGLLLAGLLSGSQPLRGQAGREKVLEGNRNFSEGDYDKALELYRQALEERPDSPAIRFNLGDAHFKKEELENASDSFSQALQSEDPGIKSQAQYNLGNSLYRQGKLQESLSAYREAKHNLEFVLKQLQEQQQEKKNQDQQGEGEQEENENKNRDESQSGGEDQSQQDRQEPSEEQESQDQQGEEQQSRDQNDRQDSESPEDRPEDEPEKRDEKSRAGGGDQQQEPAQEDQAQASPDGSQPMSREEAERLLEALAQAQAGVKKKLEMRPGTVRVEKDW